jgi:uncharacterized protein
MEKKVEFKIGQEFLRGSMFIPQGKGPFPSVIFFHGSGGNGEAMFEMAHGLSEKGILGLAFNYRGAGVSGGKFEDQTIESGIADGKAAVNYFLSQKEVDNKRFGFLGGSFGGFIASLIANNFNPKSLALVAPAAYSPRLYEIQRDADNDLRQDFEKSDSYKEIARFKGSLLVVRSEFEDVLPLGMVEKYSKEAVLSAKKENYLLEGANHRISINPEAARVLREKISSWFLKTL